MYNVNPRLAQIGLASTQASGVRDQGVRPIRRPSPTRAGDVTPKVLILNRRESQRRDPASGKVDRIVMLIHVHVYPMCRFRLVTRVEALELLNAPSDAAHTGNGVNGGSAPPPALITVVSFVHVKV